MDRRNFIKSSAIFGGALAALGPFQALSARRAMGNCRSRKVMGRS